MEWFLIYMFVMIEKFAAALHLGWLAFWIGLVGLGFTLFVAGLSAIDARRTTSEQMKQPIFKTCTKLFKWAMILGFITGMLSHFIPSQKDLAIIVGSGVTYKIVTSEKGQIIGGKAFELLQKKLDDAIGNTVESIPEAVKPSASPTPEGSKKI